MRVTDEELSRSISDLINGFMELGITSPTAPSPEGVLANLINNAIRTLSHNVGVNTAKNAVMAMLQDMLLEYHELQRQHAERDKGCGGLTNETD